MIELYDIKTINYDSNTMTAIIDGVDYYKVASVTIKANPPNKFEVVLDLVS